MSFIHRWLEGKATLIKIDFLHFVVSLIIIDIISNKLLSYLLNINIIFKAYNRCFNVLRKWH